VKHMKCPYCSTDNPNIENFCTNCGAYLNPSGDILTVVSSNDATATSVANTPSYPPVSGAFASPTSGEERKTTTTLVPGWQLQNGRYVVEKMLGQGGMGAAVLARDTRVSNKQVVIKELVSDNADPDQREAEVRNFEREVETLAHLDHPLIPTVTDSFQEGTRYYMVQEYVAGENLEDRLARLKGPLPEHDAVLYASQVLAILDYLARQQPPIVHRDIKPANIIISSKDNLAHLVDFGIARAGEAKNAQRKQTSALGTPGYAPPEQYQGNADARSDIYALAATLHHLLTNRDPSDYPAFNYPSVCSLDPNLSPEIDRILTRALSIDITKRYQNAAAMKYDIDEMLQHRFAEPSPNTSIYMRGYTGTVQVPPPPPVAPTPSRSPEFISSPAPERRSEQFGREPSPYEDKRRQRQERMVDFEEPVRQQQQMQMFEFEQPSQRLRPINRMFQSPFQEDAEHRYVLFSFVMLLVVIVLILLILFYMSTWGGGGF
jgi:eukaryotic-like serine/threonine-protein kinase